MSTGSFRGPSVRFSWRWLLDAPLLHVVWLCVIVAVFVALDVAGAIERAGRLQERAGSALAHLVAEEAAVHLSGGGDPVVAGAEYSSRAQFPCRVEDVTSYGGVVLSVAVAGRQDQFFFEILSGSAPEAFALPLTARESVPAPSLGGHAPAVLGDTGFPHLLPRVLELDASTWVRRGSLRRDDALALLRLPSGTDRIDFTFAGTRGGPLALDVPDSGVVCLDGHLWVDRGSEPLWLNIERNLTVVVRGNLYLGRSLRVTGGGKLFLVTRIERGGAFADRDGDGRWSPGDARLPGGALGRRCIEGTGAVFLGLPGHGHDLELDLGASLVAGGELHLLAERAVVRGALMLGAGVTRPGEAPAELRATGERLPDVAREAVPGFPVSGARRPGALRPLAAR